MRTIIITLLLGVALSGCTGINEKMARIGTPPQQSPVMNPTQKSGYQPVSMPMPESVVETREANSLWSSGRQTFFKDQRARTVGDILTVLVEIDDKADMKDETKSSRTTDNTAHLTHLYGLENLPSKLLPSTYDPENAAALGSDYTQNGKGDLKRNEKINLKLATVVTQILPNGNMVVSGSQEVRVNFENRVLQLSGVIRPEDITIDNTIGYEKIAEARISYGGKGQIMDIQQPPYGHQLFNAIFPF